MKSKTIIPLLELTAIVVSLLLRLFNVEQIGEYLLLIAILLGFFPLVIDVVKMLLSKNFGVDLLALLSISGSLLLGEYLAGAIIVLMLSGGELLEEYALKRSRSELTKLLSSTPTEANVLVGEKLTTVGLDQVKIEDIVLVKPGEVVPLDGIVEEGEVNVDESNLTGESIPILKQPGDKIFSGTVAKDALVKVRVTTLSKDSKYQQLVSLVKEAVEAKAPFVRLADKYSVWFTVLALILSLVGFIVSGGDMTIALSVLVVATPCPLILATPVAFSSGVSIAAKQGAVFKSGAAIEKLDRMTYLVFDKTGTLTLGKPLLEDSYWVDAAAAAAASQHLSAVSAIEQYSKHVLSQTLVKISDSVDKLPEVSNFAEVFGKGVSGIVNTNKYLVGNLGYLETEDVDVQPLLDSLAEQQVDIEADEFVKVFVSQNGRAIGLLRLRDQARPEAKAVLKRLRDNCNIQMYLSTGDKELIASKMAQEFGIEKYQSEALPEEKLATIAALQAEQEIVGMVGDGVNDAPAIAKANVGIALGYLGTSATTEAADVVITSNNLDVLARIIQISHGVLKVARQGIFIGIGLSILLMIVAIFGLLPPTFGALSQEVIDVLVILNALRARGIKVEA